MNLKLFLLLLTVAFVSSQAPKSVVTINLADYNGCVPMLDRPPYPSAVPSDNIYLDGEVMTATRHHIIPYNVLSTFFNTVLQENPDASSFGEYLSMRVRQIYNFFGITPGAGAFPPGRAPHATLNGRRTLTIEVDNRMMAAFAWMPGNIFYGPPPMRRRDDPGLNFENFARVIVGEEAHETLRRLYDNMRTYNTDPLYRTRSNIDKIFEDLYTIAQRSIPYEFNPNNWFVAGSRTITKDGKKIKQNMFAISGDAVYKITTSTTTTRRPAHDELKRSARQATLRTLNTFLASVSDSSNTPKPKDVLQAVYLVCESIKQKYPMIYYM